MCLRGFPSNNQRGTETETDMTQAEGARKVIEINAQVFPPKMKRDIIPEGEDKEIIYGIMHQAKAVAMKFLEECEDCNLSEEAKEVCEKEKDRTIDEIHDRVLEKCSKILPQLQWPYEWSIMVKGDGEGFKFRRSQHLKTRCPIDKYTFPKEEWALISYSCQEYYKYIDSCSPIDFIFNPEPMERVKKGFWKLLSSFCPHARYWAAYLDPNTRTIWFNGKKQPEGRDLSREYLDSLRS
jgi:hypothetical protein